MHTLTVAGGRDAGQQILAIPKRLRPTAAFCGNDLLALGLLQTLTSAGVRVPEDFAIVGYGDIEFADAAAVPLSSVRQARHRIGYEATRLLIDEASNEHHQHEHLVIAPELIVRRSSDYGVASKRLR
jgi:LacI family transcriptional regulator